MHKLNLRERFDRISDEVGIDEDEANELITAAGIDVDVAYTRLVKRIKEEKAMKKIHGLLILSEEWDLITLINKIADTVVDRIQKKGVYPTGTITFGTPGLVGPAVRRGRPRHKRLPKEKKFCPVMENGAPCNKPVRAGVFCIKHYQRQRYAKLHPRSPIKVD